MVSHTALFYISLPLKRIPLYAYIYIYISLFIELPILLTLILFFSITLTALRYIIYLLTYCLYSLIRM